MNFGCSVLTSTSISSYVFKFLVVHSWLFFFFWGGGGGGGAVVIHSTISPFQCSSPVNRYTPIGVRLLR